MKLATFEYLGRRSVGLVRDGKVFDIVAIGSTLPGTMEALLALGAEGLSFVRKLAPAPSLGIDLASVQLCAPVSRPRKFLAIGGNFRSHLAEVNAPAPSKQIWFNKQVTCIAGPFDDIHIPRVSQQLDYEGEMAVVIGERCRHVSRRDAHRVIAGYCVCNDVSVRDWQTRAVTATLGKSFDTHGPIGPWITTADEVADPHSMRIRTWVDGDLRQDGNTSECVYSIGEMIEELSTVFTLEPGDILSTGTPAGVGAWRTPPDYLRAGQVVRIEVEGLGHIENTVIAEPVS